MDSNAQIEKLVDEILASKLNIPFIPDSLERQIDTKLLTLLIHLLISSVENIKIQLLGYQITLNVQPAEKS